MLTIVDHGYANVGSVLNMCRKLGLAAKLSADPDIVAGADFLILPGVGAFDAGMGQLNKLGLKGALDEAVLSRGVPLVGICLGMQFLLESSEEGVLPGLGYIKGQVVKFPSDMPGERGLSLKVPHMGWNRVEAGNGQGFFGAFESNEDPTFYFVHSYYARLSDPLDEAGVTEYGVRFTSAVQRGNVIGFQFHPEKSHEHGMRLLAKVLEPVSERGL